MNTYSMLMFRQGRLYSICKVFMEDKLVIFTCGLSASKILHINISKIKYYANVQEA